MTRYCNECGKPLKDDAQFCMHCGTPVHVAPQQDTKQIPDADPIHDVGGNQTVDNKPRQKDYLVPTWLLGVFAFLAVVALIVFVLYLTKPFSSSASSELAVATTAAESEAASTEAATAGAASPEVATPEAATSEPAATTSASSYVNGIGNESTEYILPDSQTRVYSTSELSVLTTAQLELARNEIFARYGREFKTDYIRAHFMSKPWYTVRYSAEAFDAIQNDVFNSVEKQNIENIKAVEATR